MSAFPAAADGAASHGPEGGFVLALAHDALRELELDRQVRRA
ncbi:MAG: hypothetical protein WBP81_20995 [Solirubrobacteraceae bacterium]